MSTRKENNQQCAEIKYIDGILYMNTGDWVESLTAIGDTMDGQLIIIRWNDYNENCPNASVTSTS
jgi:hypothetical protein